MRHRIFKLTPIPVYLSDSLNALNFCITLVIITIATKVNISLKCWFQFIVSWDAVWMRVKSILIFELWMFGHKLAYSALSRNRLSIENNSSNDLNATFMINQIGLDSAWLPVHYGPAIMHTALFTTWNNGCFPPLDGSHCCECRTTGRRHNNQHRYPINNATCDENTDATFTN